jgi:signal transduction histidine kinase
MMGSRRPRLRSLRNKLALVFFAITAVAFSVIYLSVATQPESNLQERRLRDLELLSGIYKSSLRLLVARDISAEVRAREVRRVAEDTDSQVTLYAWDENPEGPQNDWRGIHFKVLFDSRAGFDYPRANGLLLRALKTRKTHTAYSVFQGDDVGLVAQPLMRGGRPRGVALYSRDFKEVDAAVSYIKNRVVLATLAAAVLAMLGGWLVARRLGRRVRRLEVAAEEVTRGTFVDPLPVDSKDELGQLTRTFNEMQAQLRQVDVARKEFIATASHELRTPIFSLAGFVELLQDEELDESTRREFLETMAEQVERLQKLSVDLLDLSRLDAGSLELQPEPVDLAELARSIVGEFTPAIADHGTDLEMQLPADGPDALCDRQRVAQIMRILLDNALRHTPEGTDVTVSAIRYNGAAELTVADRGPGLPAGARGKVFERFFTGDAARGAGLGLAIARELAERMDGRLVLTSDNGSTAFTLELPADGNGA